jgi:hypothetical protein
MRLPYLVIIFVVSSLTLFAQYDLTKYKVFFQQQKEEFSFWLQSNGMDKVFFVSDLNISQDKLILKLQSQFETDDSLNVAWDEIQQAYYELSKRRISEKMFDLFIFLCDLEPELAEIHIYGKQSRCIRIYYDKYFKLEEGFPKKQSEGGNIEIPLENIKYHKTGSQFTQDQKGVTVSELTKDIGTFLYEYYKEKNGGIYKVNVDTSRSYVHHFVYRITCLKNEIIQNNFFEFIQIKVVVTQQSQTIQLQYDIQGKYAPYLRCPKQRDEFYKSIEAHYPDAIENYTEHIHNKLESFLRRGY